VKKLQDQAKEVDAQRVVGKFVSASGEIPDGNEEMAEILEKCLRWSETVLERYIYTLLLFILVSADTNT
jgi:hypothetical protein